jgi:hypothetical protein
MASGPLPKHPSQRRRRNTVSTTKTLVAVSRIEQAPLLPAREEVNESGEVEPWHPASVEFWDSLWSSPMASEYDWSDLPGLLVLADLIHNYWSAKSGMVKKEYAAEIRLQRREYGLGPMSRRSLQWSIEQAEEASDKGERRRARNRSGGADDPRLKAIDAEAEDKG